jgi:hypothetical protein
LRLRADIFVAALIRRVASEGAFAVLRRRGAAEAGAIFVKIDCLDGRTALFGPAPQTELAESLERGVDRVFARVHRGEWVEPHEAERRLKREIDFDRDLWIVEIEDPDGRAFVDLAK